MTEFTVTITDPNKLDGITAARAAFNASEQTDENDEVIQFDTNHEYVQFVMDKAAESYAKQYGTE